MPSDSLSARLATITTDTGAFAPGHRDFARYDNPGLCRAAALVTREDYGGHLLPRNGRLCMEICRLKIRSQPV